MIHIHTGLFLFFFIYMYIILRVQDRLYMQAGLGCITLLHNSVVNYLNTLCVRLCT